MGAELYKRDVDAPQPVSAPFSEDAGSRTTVDQDDDLYRAYMYWTPYTDWALSWEIVQDRFRSEASAPGTPKQLNTILVPLAVNYFSPSGFFAGLSATYVNQDVFKPGGRVFQATNPEGNDQSVIVDAGIGYRMPDRRGIISLLARNVSNGRLKYQDDSFREVGSASPKLSPFIPERSFFAQLSV